jgi:hypothetical protein
VARVAQNILEQKSPGTLTEVEDILAVLKKSDPSWTTNEMDHPMVECTTFADDIKYKGGAYQSGWHFIDSPFLDEGGKISDYNFTMDAHNITEAINDLTAWFNKESGYENTNAYKNIMSHGAKGHTEEDGLSTAMRLLIHYAGDIHQPLHATSRVDHEYPEGDRGGNSFPLPSKEGAKNLHAVWDSVIYEFVGHEKLPFTVATWKMNGDAAQKLMDTYTVGPEAKDLDPVQWGIDSFKTSSEFVYAHIKEGDVLPADYTEKARPIAEKAIVLAGNRLANLLMSLKLKNTTSETEVAFLQ